MQWWHSLHVTQWKAMPLVVQCISTWQGFCVRTLTHYLQGSQAWLKWQQCCTRCCWFVMQGSLWLRKVKLITGLCLHRTHSITTHPNNSWWSTPTWTLLCRLLTSGILPDRYGEKFNTSVWNPDGSRQNADTTETSEDEGHEEHEGQGNNNKTNRKGLKMLKCYDLVIKK